MNATSVSEDVPHIRTRGIKTEVNAKDLEVPALERNRTYCEAVQRQRIRQAPPVTPFNCPLFPY